MILNQIASGGGDMTPAAPAEWVRPSDWPALPAALTDDLFDGLLAIQDAPDGNVYAALSATVVGGFTVAWGDGTTDTWASGATAEHVYSYADVALGPVTERGYKTAIVTVTSTTPGSAWSAFSLQKRHSTLMQAAESGWLDVQLQAPSMTSLAVGASTLLARVAMLERVRLGTHSITNTSRMFQNCYSLASVPLFDTASVINMSNMFANCYSLASVPLFDTASVTNMSVMFWNCNSLTSVPLFDTASVTNMSYMFNNCYSLASVPLFDTASVINMSYMFTYCYSLASGALEGTKVSISYVNCSLSAAALDAIYTGLATATSTITITGNRGAAASTKTIATNKGWTVTN